VKIIVIRQNGRYFTKNYGWASSLTDKVMSFQTEIEARALAKETFNWRNFSEKEMEEKLAQLEFIEIESGSVLGVLRGAC